MMFKKVIAVIVTASIALSLFVMPANAASFSSFSASIKNTVYQTIDKVINTVVGGIASTIKDPGWVEKSDYVSENFYEGMGEQDFINTPSANARWSLGYSSASLQTGEELDGKHYVGGSLSLSKKVATAIYDDQRVRTVAISDGRGVTIFAVIDAYGFANSDVREIRSRLSAFAQANDIISLNISTLHQHSCVDTFGMNGDLLNSLFLSPVRNILGIKNTNGKNDDYMENLYTVVEQSVKDAVNGMMGGQLYFGTFDVEEYIRDKRDPQVFDTNINRLRFVPDSESAKETWLLNLSIHCVGNGAAGTVVTGDYPYYMEEYITTHKGANVAFIQGAELAITMQADSVVIDEGFSEQYGERYARLSAYGTKLGELTCSIDNDELVEPILNIKHKEIYIPIENNILVFAGKLGLLPNKVLKTDDGGYEIATEIGYAEIGKDLAVAIIPGEMSPEIAYGGAMSADESWQGASWDYPSMEELSSTKKLLVFGLSNDQVGYILSDNSWHSILTENEEIVSAGKNTGSTVMEEYMSFF